MAQIQQSLPIPNDLLYVIFDVLDSKELGIMTSVCLQFKEILTDPIYLRNRLSKTIVVSPDVDPRIYLIIAPCLLRAIQEKVNENPKVRRKIRKNFPGTLSITLKNLQLGVFVINANSTSEKYFRLSKRDMRYIRAQGCNNSKIWNDWITCAVEKIKNHKFFPQVKLTSSDNPLLKHILLEFGLFRERMRNCVHQHQIKEMFLVDDSTLVVSGNHVTKLTLATLHTAAFDPQEYTNLTTEFLILHLAPLLGHERSIFEEEQFQALKLVIHLRAVESGLDLDDFLLNRTELAPHFLECFPDVWRKSEM